MYIYDFTMGLKLEQRVTNKFFVRLRKLATEALEKLHDQVHDTELIVCQDRQLVLISAPLKARMQLKTPRLTYLFIDAGLLKHLKSS